MATPGRGLRVSAIPQLPQAGAGNGPDRDHLHGAAIVGVRPLPWTAHAWILTPEGELGITVENAERPWLPLLFTPARKASNQEDRLRSFELMNGGPPRRAAAMNE
ncbi:hypothetical protein [Embleya sp. NPDC020886]|uniref:hypothetical protein n=1 Tax=Embleya sp. NPDC020886 TaxID=3363980 RepID=UPI0037B26814